MAVMVATATAMIEKLVIQPCLEKKKYAGQ